MKIYGYEMDSEEESPMRLSEVTLCTDPSTLRKLSEFMLEVASAMEKHGESFGHEHFEDYDRTRKKVPSLIVTRETGSVE